MFVTFFTMMHTMKHILILFLTIQALYTCSGQVITDIPVDSAQLKEYEQRTRLTRIDGKYIPKDLNDAMLELNKIMEQGARQKFQKMTEDDARTKTHFSFGKYINARWSIMEGSRLTLWFQKNKIYNYDDMIDCVIVAYHRTLNNKPIQFEELATYYYKKQQEMVRKLQKEKEARKTRSKQK